MDVWNEFAELDFETDVALSQKQGTHSVIADTTREDSTKVLQVDKNSRAQYSQSATLPKGYYRVSGYVKLGNADASKVSISIWAYKNSTGTNPIAPTMANSIIGRADENGWSYFEMDFDHGENYSLVQIIINNYDTANVVLFDDVVYAQYTGEGVPPATEAPAEPDPNWDALANVDLEAGQTLTQKQGTISVVDDATRTGSTKVLKIEKNSRAQYSQTISNTVLTAGDYKLTGYVKLGNADATKVSATIWAYKNPTGNTVTPVMADSIVGEADANGWCYFEMPFTLGEKYTLIQFILNNYDTSNSVLFDDIQYLKKVPG